VLGGFRCIYFTLQSKHLSHIDNSSFQIPQTRLTIDPKSATAGEVVGGAFIFDRLGLGYRYVVTPEPEKRVMGSSNAYQPQPGSPVF